MDEFNIRVLDLEGGKRWLRRLVDEDRGTDAYRRAALRNAIDNPEMLTRGVVWDQSGPMGFVNVLGSLIDRTSLDVREQYAQHALVVKRFAARADLFIKPTVIPDGATDILSRSMRHGRMPEPELFMTKALTVLESEGEVLFKRYEVKEEGGIDKEVGKISFLRMAEDDFIPTLFWMMRGHAGWKGMMGVDDPSYGKARRVALLNDEHGFMVMARGGGGFNAVGNLIEEALRDAFDGYPIAMTRIELAYDKADEGAMKVLLPRRDPAIGAFEDYASRVLVKGGEVELTLGSTPRPADQPLMFEYTPGAQREGWPTAKGHSLWRVETQVPHNHDNDMVFDQGFLHVARLNHLDASAEAFIQGGNDVHHIDPKGPMFLWDHLPAGERQPGMPISFMATGPAASTVVGAMWSHVNFNLGMNVTPFPK